MKSGTAMIINGKGENVATPITVAELIEQEACAPTAWLSSSMVRSLPRTQRAQTQLKGTDRKSSRSCRGG